jgi:hypothetical protein
LFPFNIVNRGKKYYCFVERRKRKVYIRTIFITFR